MQPVAGRSNYDKIIDIDHGSRQVTLDNVDLDGRINGVRQVRDGLGISGDTDYVTVQNSDLCCIPGPEADPDPDLRHLGPEPAPDPVPEHDPRRLADRLAASTWNASGSKGSATSSSTGNHFYDCALDAILANADEGGTYANWTITNNIFEAADTGVGGIPPTSTAAPKHTQSRTG